MWTRLVATLVWWSLAWGAAGCGEESAGFVSTGGAAAAGTSDGERDAAAGSGGSAGGDTGGDGDRSGRGGAGGDAGQGDGGNAGGGGAAGAAGTGGAPASGFDGDVFDPSRVYVLAFLPDDFCPVPLTFEWWEPGHLLVGFPCLEQYRIQPVGIDAADGRLMFRDIQETGWRRFHEDLGRYYSEQDVYPENLYFNDDQLLASACPGDVGVALMARDGGYVYKCNGNALTWYDEAGTELVTLELFDTFVSIGTDRVGLVREGTTGPYSLVEMNTGNRRAVSGFEAASVDHFARRSTPDGFWIAVEGDETQMIPDELWHVDLEGNASLLGTYPEPTATDVYGQKLDGEGALVGVGVDFVDADTHLSVVVRRTVSGESEVVYRESPGDFFDPGGQLFTGP